MNSTEKKPNNLNGNKNKKVSIRYQNDTGVMSVKVSSNLYELACFTNAQLFCYGERNSKTLFNKIILSFELNIVIALPLFCRIQSKLDPDPTPDSTEPRRKLISEFAKFLQYLNAKYISSHGPYIR